MEQKLNTLALGYSFALISALIMLGFGILGNLGIYMEAAKLMQTVHSFFSLSVIGIITGMIEAGVWGFIFGWLIGYFYNRFQ